MHKPNTLRSEQRSSLCRASAAARHVQQSRIHPTCRRLRCIAQAAAATLDADQLVVTASTPEQYFPAADLHATCFGHSRDANQALLQRFDRIWALQINDDLARRGAGSCQLLIAYDPSRASPNMLQNKQGSTQSNGISSSSSGNGHSIGFSSSTSSSTQPSVPDLEQFAFPSWGYWLSRMVGQGVWPQLGTAFADLGIVGVAQVDTFGDLIPPRTMSATRDGMVGWLKRDGYAYISNVAVSPAHRRSGVAVRLMAEAESLAAAWGCEKAGLHCNPTNTAAMQLYKRLRYKKAALEAPWMPYLQGRAPDRCYLMVKRLQATQQRHESATQHSSDSTSERWQHHGLH